MHTLFCSKTHECLHVVIKINVCHLNLIGRITYLMEMTAYSTLTERDVFTLLDITLLSVFWTGFMVTLSMLLLFLCVRLQVDTLD